MVITVTCPSCSSSFPVDPDKIPPKGVSARCSTCGDVFRIEKPVEAEAAPPAAPEPDPLPPPSLPVEEPEAEEPAAVVEEPAVVEQAPSFGEVEVVPPPAVQPPPLPEPEAPVAAPVAEPAEPAGDSGFRFGKRDPTDKAKRLARVLVSDMIMYNADRHVSALENGTLSQDFEEEIDKSWKEFVEQVGPEIADGPGRGFWTDALNDILAKGEQLF